MKKIILITCIAGLFTACTQSDSSRYNNYGIVNPLRPYEKTPDSTLHEVYTSLKEGIEYGTYQTFDEVFKVNGMIYRIEEELRFRGDTIKESYYPIHNNLK